ncbi:iron uptake transporter deferrochelatase/peroxidase subunit [Cohnella sp. JJ-181]|uniref:iron uptake transporter deferrochelatase/peroxidase subunit n=1 Tax=Cohnella rhizoplanae TaxID=2974897 RepID=UPI0022FFB2BE|nr:iron uptake transporter deferrochelatase/peroxidase subunit [Cohnella sp. JJ-181]CAI6086516.1 putative deferrochelatase/peroxidase EfeN [Cohnella sp. JJ-181]
MEQHPPGMTRKDFLKLSVAAGAGLAIGASGLGAILNLNGKPANKASAESNDDAIPLYGAHQPGIVTPPQTYLYLASFRVTSKSKADLAGMFKDWTRFCDLSMAGGTMRTGDNPLVPPSDTGETLDLPPSKLTVTFGFGPSFFLDEGKDRFGIARLAPKHLKDIPRMARDHLDPSISGGDICLQVCANDQQVAFHAIRNLIRLSTGIASLNWMQEGFASGKPGTTPRNLFGFKDGTANALHDSPDGYDRVVWADEGEPDWLRGGSYLAYRKIRMKLESWDRTSLADQEDTFGRHKVSGAAYGAKGEFDPVDLSSQPVNAHVHLAKQTKQQMHRRAYSYTDKVDPRTGNVDAGLLFISYQRNPDEQFIRMLRLMQSKDALNEYVDHVASAMFACPTGLREGTYIGQNILEG